MTITIKWQLSPQQEELKDFLKKNWLKGIGFFFLCLASGEYLQNHRFGCNSSAALLLIYAMFHCYRKARQAELVKNYNEASFYFNLVVGCYRWLRGYAFFGVPALATPTNIRREVNSQIRRALTTALPNHW